MRDQLSNLSLDRALRVEDYFLAGPAVESSRGVHKLRHDALLADIRRQPRRARQRVAA